MAEENTVFENIKKAINELVTLRIVTAVGEITKDEKGVPVIDYSQNPRIILTSINLIQGDITTVFHEEFVTGKYQSLQVFHAAREKEGYELIKKNIEVLEKLYEVAKSVLGK